MTENAPGSLSRHVYLALKRDILECKLPPNADLREQVLAERFIVSKSPVREALVRLEHDHLVIVSPRQGYRVAPVSVEDAADTFGLRKILEGACAEAAVANGSRMQLEDLDRFRTFTARDSEDPSDGFIRYNREFHAAICAIARNSRLERMTMELVDQMERMIRMSVNSVPVGGRAVLLREHCDMIDAIQSGDRRRASALTRQHIGKAEKRVVTGLAYAAIHA
jgi:DNA-binding GntR family transcriptional regulator